MARRRSKHLPAMVTWTCPHCGHEHTPATLRRLGSGTLKCQACERLFASIPDKEEQVIGGTHNEVCPK